MVIDLVMLSAPKPPGSRTLISPPVAVFEIAPAKVLHGAVRLHGLASSPTPETQVRVAWPKAGAAQPRLLAARAMATKALRLLIVIMSGFPSCCSLVVGSGAYTGLAGSRTGRIAVNRALTAFAG